ncbi:fatty acid synthase-like [Thrips palmi]|uniref:Fatty acid synthase-like n=1 Tax=Thrips palmi TaxID=161013 RepID=A0A6P8YFA7_THRPL|nr:fatty acid synthase-like [Thrips palmi]XP_034238383.1 fatty acid synthase-like [Thrips palmi]
MAPVEAVISGIGGAFPQSEGLQNFIDNLLDGKNLSSVDDLRWKPGLLGTSPHVGKIANTHRFDNNLFKVHRPLARLMDPMARLMLERSMEAVLDAGLAPKDIENTYTSVFMTTTVSESESRTTSILHAKKDSGYAIMAGSKTMMSNRISYCLNLNGPSVTLDGDWTVAMVALQRAAHSIETGESDFALVGAANTCLFPELNKIYENLGVLSTDGLCRVLDESATGCFRSESAVVFLLQRADLANRVYARVGGVREVCRGTRSRFLGVDTLALSPLMEDLYREKSVDVNNVALLTSDGISIPEIERDEMEASAAVLCRTRSGLPVSAAKAVAGHGDAVGALISIIHSIAAMERGVIPPLKDFTTPHPDATALQDGRVQVVKEVQPVALDESSVLAVNALGYSGCIAHSIFRPNTKVKVPPSEESKQYPRLVVVSGRTEDDAVSVVEKVIDTPFDPEFIRLTQQAFSKPIIGYTARAMTILPSDEPGMRPLIASKEADAKDRPVWFVYSGMGSQWAGMGKGLLKLPIFAETIARLQPILEPEGINLTKTLTTDDSSHFDNIIHAFISIAAIQIGLTNVMRELGVEPDGIIGHSTGELGCAYGDGCMSEEEVLRAAYARGKASLEKPLIRGMMASIGMSCAEAEAVLPPTIDVACHNSADNCTISGPTADVDQFVEELKEKNVFARTVNVSNIAFHSRYVQPAGPVLESYLRKVIKTPKKRSARWVSSSINPGDENKPELAYASVEYFTNNLLSPVRFEDAMKSVPAGAVVVELAPHGLMQPLIRRGLPEGAATFSLTQRGHRDGLRFLLESVGKLFMECVPVKPWVLAPEVSMPVSRGTPSLNTLASWDHREEWPLVINTRSQTTRPRTVPLYPETTACIAQAGKRCAAPSTFLEIVWKELADNKPLVSCPVIFSDLEFINPVESSAKENMVVELQLQRETGWFEMALSAEDDNSMPCIVKGVVQAAQPEDLLGMASVHAADLDVPKGTLTLEGDDIYDELQDYDIKYDDELRVLQRVSFKDNATSGVSRWGGSWHRLIDSLFQLAIVTDKQGDIFCGKIRKLTIAPQGMRAVSNALPIRHDIDTGVLVGPGVNIVGYRRAETKASTAMSVLDVAVRPLKTAHHDTAEFLQSVAMLRVQNSDTAEDFSVLVLEEECDAVASALQQAIREVVGTATQVRKVLLRPGAPIPKEVAGAVVLVTDFRSKQTARVIEHLEGTASISRPMALRCGVRTGLDGFVQLTTNTSADGSLSLLIESHDMSEEDTRVVHVKTDEPVPADLEVPVNGKVVLVWKGLPREGVLGAVASVRGKPYGARARIVVIADNDAPEFSLTKGIFKERLDLGLMVNVLQDGRWSECHITKFSDVPPIPTRIEGTQVHYLGLHAADDLTTIRGPFDYSGLRGGARVMGLAQSAQGVSAVADDILQWSVPAEWSDQEAATVPLAYAMAYHMLKVLAKARAGENVLVVGGVSPVAQACIRLASATGCTVFTTAGNEAQRREVLTLNPQVPAERVLRHDSNAFNYHIIKMVGSKGVNVALVPYCDHILELICRSASLNTRIVTTSTKNALAHHIGLHMFLISTELFGVSPEGLLRMTPRDKHAVRGAVLEGITTGVVKPLRACMVDSVEDVKTPLPAATKQLVCLHDGTATSATGVSAPRRPGSSPPGAAFAILGGRVDSLVTLARAASAKGSSVVLAAHRDVTTASAAAARARFVPAMRQTTFVPLPKAHADTKQFLNLASKAEGLKAIVINLEDAADRTLTSLLNAALPSVNGAMRGVRLLVLTDSLALGTETVEKWRLMGLPACALVGDARQVAKLLPSLLTISELPTAVVAYQQGTDCRVALGAPTYRSLRGDVVEKLRASRAAQGRCMVEVATLAPRLRYRHHRLEPLPLFAVSGPGLTPSLLADTAAGLLSPLLVGCPGDLTAELLAQEILLLQPRGPWALCGDAESAEMLLSAASLVERKAGRPNWQEVVHLALLEVGGDLAKAIGNQADHIAGPLHLIRHHEEEQVKSTILNENKTRHFVANAQHIATVMNESLLSPLSKIISC